MHVEQKADLQSHLAAWDNYVHQDWLDMADLQSNLAAWDNYMDQDWLDMADWQ